MAVASGPGHFDGPGRVRLCVDEVKPASQADFGYVGVLGVRTGFEAALAGRLAWKEAPQLRLGIPLE